MRAQERVADRYELTYPLGRGGMGEVWAGFDEKLDRPVAIKFLRKLAIPESERGTAVERFMREARVTARLDHPGVPSVHDVGYHGDDDLYIVMQIVPGVVLADLIAERGWLSVAWAAAIGAQICSVLAAAHAASLVHRDLKPQNLMVTHSGAVKVLDFGVAALLGPDVPRLTATHHTLGTPTYMAPEQALNSVVGPRADLYALGCVLCELLTGEPPYRADSPFGVLQRHLNDPVPSVAERRADVPDELVRLVTRLLAKDPQDRPGSAAEVYEILVPFGAVEPGGTADPATTGTGGQQMDPTMPYRRPFGPLPPREPSTPGGTAVARPRTAPEPAARPSADELAQVQDRVWALAEEERFTQAAELLETALRPVLKGREGKQPRILELRLDLANLYVLAGAYRRALPEFLRLAADLAGRPTPDQELIWHCRQQAAVCQVELGEGTAALAELRSVLAEEQRALPAAAPELFALRQHIAMLAAGVGEVTEARRELRGLLDDVGRVHGRRSTAVKEIDTLLSHLDHLDPADEETTEG